MSELWVVGDVHGALGKLRSLLLRAALIGPGGDWTGEDTRLVFLGDYLDRGPDGAEVVQLIRTLEAQAPLHGGEVLALLGNHEAMLLAARTFTALDPADRLGFRDYWLSNGGQERDLQQLRADDLAWIRARPAMWRLDRWLLVHADSPFYLRLGTTPQAVNAAVSAMLDSTDPEAWGLFLNAFTQRLAFLGRTGERAARTLLRTFGGEQIVHGHTPVYLLAEATGADLAGPVPPQPALYAEGLCLNVDSGMAYRDDAGFILRLTPAGVAEVLTHAERVTCH